MQTLAEQLRSWRRTVQRSPRTTPVLSVLLGLIALAIQSARGDVSGGVWSLAIMLVFALGLTVFGSRSETVSLLRGDIVDERSGQIQLHALATTGGVLVVVLVAGFLVELARGGSDVSVWSGLCALGGVTFGLSLLVLSRRS